jgi:hypothetical protein
MAVNTNYLGLHDKKEFELADVRGRIKQVLFGEVQAGSNGEIRFKMGRTSVAAVIVHDPKKKEEEIVSRWRKDPIPVAVFSG